jgi:hypothetical protein
VPESLSNAPPTFDYIHPPELRPALQDAWRQGWNACLRRIIEAEPPYPQAEPPTTARTDTQEKK